MDVCGSSQLLSVREYFTCLATNVALTSNQGQSAWAEELALPVFLYETSDLGFVGFHQGISLIQLGRPAIFVEYAGSPGNVRSATLVNSRCQAYTFIPCVRPIQML
jgi:hypothetical protein